MNTITKILHHIYYANEKLDYKKDLEKQSKQSDYNEVKKYSIGLRYDFSKNIAFKISYIKKIDNTYYDNFSDDQNDEKILKGAINVLF